MPSLWPYEVIRELLARAELLGSSEAACASLEEAESFRFAIYHFRREKNFGQGVTITLDGNKVVLTKKYVPEVTILNAKGE